MAKLTAKQKRFCDEYLIDLNATKAAIRAGYKEKNAYQIGSENLRKPQIQQYICERMSSKENELIASQDEVLQYLTSVMRGKSKSAEIVVEGVGEGVSEARIIEKPPSEKDRLKAAELLGKRYGSFTDQEEKELKKQKLVQETERLKRMNNDTVDDDDGVEIVIEGVAE